MARVACSLVLLAVVSVSARGADLPPGALARLGDDRFLAGGGIEHLALSPDGKQFATVRNSGRATFVLTMWNAETGSPVREQEISDELFKGFVWGKGGGFAVVVRAEPGTDDAPAKVTPDDFRVWDFTDPKAQAPPMLPTRQLSLGGPEGVEAERSDNGSEYTDFQLSADGTRLAARRKSARGADAVHVFDLKPTDTAAKLKRAGTIDLGAEGADAVRLSADGKTVVAFRKLANDGTSECTATAWDVATGKPGKPVRVPFGKRLMATPDASGVVAFVAENGERGFDHHDLATGKRRQIARWRNGSTSSQTPEDWGGFAFAPSGRELVVATDWKTHVIDLATGKELGRLEGHAPVPTDGARIVTAVSADGARIATADRSGLVRLWDAKTLRAVGDAPGHRAPVEYAQLSPNGKHLLTWAPDLTVRLWDVATGKELRAFTGATDEHPPVFAPDGTTIVYTTEQRLIARDLQTGLEVPRPNDAKAPEPRAAILSTNHTSTSAARNSDEVHLYETASGERRHTLKGHRGSVRVLGFTADGTKLLTAGGDHTVLVWDMRLQSVPLPDAIKKETNAAKLWDTLATGKADAAYLAMARLSREPGAALRLLKSRLQPAAKGDPETDATKLTDCRAIELLEALGTDESHALLKAVAGGEANAFRTQEAKRALEQSGKK